jgi:hypothetical protein
MTRFKLLAAALLVSALSLPMAASADDAPGVFKIPGTESTIKIYGYVQLDATVDFSGRTIDIENNDWATALFAVPADGTANAKHNPQTYLTARTSRLGIQTNTPSSYGNIGVKLEGDFNAPNGFQSETFTNSVIFRLRHAYGTMGNALVGQTWSTFLDLGAAPDTVDFNGPGSLALVRNPMIRYTAPLAEGMTLALALENNRGAQFAANPTTADSRFQTIPDIHANFTVAGGWGHLSLRAVAQDYVRQVGTTGNESNKSLFSVSGAVSGSAKFGGDTLVGQFSGGNGIGRYLLNAAGAGDAGTHGFIDVVGTDLKAWTVMAYHLGYTHVWSGAFRSNLVWSQTFITDPKISGVAATNATQKDMSQLFVNSFWSTSKTTEIGVEYAYGQWNSFGPNAVKGTQNRINASFHYNFF